MFAAGCDYVFVHLIGDSPDASSIQLDVRSDVLQGVRVNVFCQCPVELVLSLQGELLGGHSICD